MTNDTIHTKRLVLRRVAAQDWHDIQAIWESNKHTEYAQYDVPFDTADDAVQQRIGKWASACGSKDHLFFAVCLDGLVIGYCAFNVRPDSYEAGYCFHVDYHRNGYAKESLVALFVWLKAQKIAGKITARTALNNFPSVRLLTSLGFQKTGIEQVSFYQDENGTPIYFEGGIFELDL